MVSGSHALLYFLLGFHGGRQGSGPYRGRSPVESGDFRPFVRPFVRPSPPSRAQEPARQALDPARQASEPASQARMVRTDGWMDGQTDRWTDRRMDGRMY